MTTELLGICLSDSLNLIGYNRLSTKYSAEMFSDLLWKLELIQTDDSLLTSGITSFNLMAIFFSG